LQITDPNFLYAEHNQWANTSA